MVAVMVLKVVVIVELNLALYSDVFRFSSVNKKKVLTNIYNPLYPDSLFGFKQTF
jgi:hypothetical protein